MYRMQFRLNLYLFLVVSENETINIQVTRQFPCVRKMSLLMLSEYDRGVPIVEEGNHYPTYVVYMYSGLSINNY